MRAQDDQDRAFAAMFEPHGDSYLVFGKNGGALFSAEERDAYVAEHRKAKPGWKTFPIMIGAIAGVAIIELVALNTMLSLWPALRSSANLVAGALVVIALSLPVALIGALAYPVLSLVARVRREADRRPLATPPHARPHWTRKLPNWIAFLGVIGLVTAQVAGWTSPTWPWIAAACGVAGMVAYVVSRPKGT